jgi:hypothetical protein
VNDLAVMQVAACKQHKVTKGKKSLARTRMRVHVSNGSASACGGGGEWVGGGDGGDDGGSSSGSRVGAL